MKLVNCKALVSGILVASVFGSQIAFVPASRADDLPAPLKSSASTSTVATELTPSAVEVAGLLGILSKVERLRQIERARTASDSMSDEEMALKVDVLDRVMKGSLEVRMVSGRIDRELAWSFSSQGALNAKKQKYLNYLFAANFLQGGVLGVLSGPEFLHHRVQTGTELLLLASSIGLSLSLVSLAVASSGSKKMDGDPTVLTYLFDLPAPEPEHKPDIVVKYMNAVPPNATDKRSRKQILIDSWKTSHFIANDDETTLRKLAVFPPQGEQYKENLKLVSSRIRLLFDTQYTIEQLDGDLLQILRACDIN